ncbi:MAG: lipopolysaccharide heptosyltransferase II [Betaproteobacteria bacterium]|nr:lipopolysaccharide heptosyltransferase II [Betaproteobacteria bacterium]PWB63191.1 MAG: lipopolysaccharide heptosyltransferase II [Betaproteobacteria bacterium]
MSETLVVSPSWIGDAVLTHPLLVRLKARDPGGAIDVLAPAWASAVYGRMPEVRRTIAFPFGHGELKLGERRRFAKTLPRYDRAIVLPGSLKSALVPWFAGIPVRTGWRGEMRYGLLNDLRRLDVRSLPLIVERYAALAQPAGEALERPLPSPRLAIDEARREATVARLGLGGDAPVLALAPGAEYGPAKRWPARHFAEVARAHAARGYRVWLVGSAKDAPITAEVASLAGVAAADLAGRTSLDEAIDLLSLASRVVCNDSGLMHVAAALDRPLAAVFGSSSPDYTPPLSPRARVVSLRLDCSPCFERECPLGHTNCLEKLEPAQVLAALD